MERQYRVDSGAFVDVELELAGIGSRFIANSIDVAVQIAAAIVLGVIFFVVDAAIHPNSTPLSLGARRGEALWQATAGFVFWAIFFGYFMLFGWIWRGSSPGKRAMGIRVVRDGGLPVDPMTVVIRELVRIVEFAAGFYVFSALTLLSSKENKCWADLAAGTIVIRESIIETASLNPNP